jgi:F0F1-type ATP synthase membrane subunit b/b'
MDTTLDSINGEVDKQKTLISDAQTFLNAITLITNAYKKQIENVNKIKTVVGKVFDGWESINSLFDDGSMSAELLGMFQTLSDTGFEMREMVSETKSAITNLKAAEEGATKFGFALDTASGIVGIIVAAVKVVVGLFNYFSERRNNKINADIEANMRDVEKLQQAYEDLERQIDDAFTSDSISSLTKELNKNLEAQKREIEDNISLEEDKKDKDKDQEKIDEWNRQLEEIERQQAENIEKMFSTLTDGVLDNVLDATRGFVDAWYDAYDETGDGMKGLENNFKEMFANILKQQASLTLISPFIKDFKNQLEGYMNDSRLTTNEATALRTKWEEIAPQMNEALEQYFDSFSDVLDTDYGELSDLEKGIQGMTEDQAEVLASYWNSCRFMLSNIDTTLTRLANATLNADEASNPVVSALKEQTELIRTIRNMFNSVIDQGSSPHSGAYLKVYMP